MATTKKMSAVQIGRLISHPEYGAKKVSELTRDDLSHAGDWIGTFDQLKASIENHGIEKPLRVFFADNGEKWLLNGHHRAIAAFELGLTELPVQIEREND